MIDRSVECLKLVDGYLGEAWEAISREDFSQASEKNGALLQKQLKRLPQPEESNYLATGTYGSS